MSSPQVWLLVCVEVQNSGSLSGHGWEAGAVWSRKDCGTFCLSVRHGSVTQPALLPLFLKEHPCLSLLNVPRPLVPSRLCVADQQLNGLFAIPK